MNKQYLDLFQHLMLNCESSAEKIKEEESNNAAAQQLWEGFSKLRDKLASNPECVLNRSEYLILLTGSMIMKNQLLNDILNIQKTIQGYSLDVIPKLERIMNETKTDEEAQTLANQLFEISNT